MKLRTTLGFNNIGTAVLLQVSGNTDMDIEIRRIKALPADPTTPEARRVTDLAARSLRRHHESLLGRRKR